MPPQGSSDGDASSDDTAKSKIEQIKEAVSALGPIREYLSIIKDLKGVFDKSQDLKPDNVIPPKNDENDDAEQK